MKNNYFSLNESTVLNDYVLGFLKQIVPNGYEIVINGNGEQNDNFENVEVLNIDVINQNINKSVYNTILKHFNVEKVYYFDARRQNNCLVVYFLI